jgi:hypothetical protein
MLMADWTGQLARERMADLHRQAERQRLVRLARCNIVAALAACGVGGAGWRVGLNVRVRAPWWSRRPRPRQLERRRRREVLVRGRDVVVDLTGTPSMEFDADQGAHALRGMAGVWQLFAVRA